MTDIDLGCGHALKFVMGSGEHEGKVVGAFLTHLPCNPAAGETGGYIGLDAEVNVRSATWNVVSWDPLTIEPSIQCMRCPDHGFIRDGKWVPA